MSAQRNNSTAPRTRPGFNRPAPMRLRMGLIMRKGMDFGPLGDMETALRIDGVSLAPISTGDASLKARDPAWGLRDRDQVVAVARSHGLTLTLRAEMPANNISLLFRRT